jgi:3-oxoacyl-[acyl-carrier-protein] synthase-3
LHQANYCLDDIDLFVFHQANQFMLDHLRKKLCIPSDRFYISLKNQGNTVSSTIPIALKEAKTNGILKPGHKVMIVGFGVGYSWSAAMLQWLK